MFANASCVTQAAIDVQLAAIFVSLELFRSRWMMTSLSPGKGKKMSKRSVEGGDVVGVLDRIAKLRSEAQTRTGKFFPTIVIYEAGLDGFWI